MTGVVPGAHGHGGVPLVGGEGAGDVGGKRDIVVAHCGQEGLGDGGEVPGRQAAH